MAIVRGKGTVFNLEVATVLTAIGQIISIDLPEHAAETFEADTLDNAAVGIPHKATGRVEGGSVGLEGFLDPALASFQIMTDLLITPVLTTSNDGGSIVFANSSPTTWAFSVAGMSVGGSVVLNDGVKFNATIKLDGAVTWIT
jgi:hypothetical protein